MTTPTIPVKTRRPTTNPIQIPKGPIAAFTHEGELAWPDIPETARKMHLVPDFADQSLILMYVFCDAGTVTITTEDASAQTPATVEIVPGG